MAVVEGQRKEKPMKMKQKKIQRLEWERQVKQTAVMASPICIGQAQGGRDKMYKRRKPRQIGTSPLGWADTYSGLQMSAILMNTPQIMFLGIRFLRIALKSQHSLSRIVLQIDRRQITWSLNKEGLEPSWMRSVVSGKYLQLSWTKFHNPQEKYSDPIGSQRTSWRVLRVATISLWGSLLLARGNLVG